LHQIFFAVSLISLDLRKTRNFSRQDYSASRRPCSLRSRGRRLRNLHVRDVF